MSGFVPGISDYFSAQTLSAHTVVSGFAPLAVPHLGLEADVVGPDIV